MVLNRFPWWKNLLIVIVVFIAFIYAAPNIFGEDPAVQVSGVPGITVSDQVLNKITDTLNLNHLNYKSAGIDKRNILVRFKDTDMQLKARDIIKSILRR